MYKIVIIGNGQYPDGVLSALDVLIGKNENIIAINSNDDHTHSQLEKDLTAVLQKNEEVLIFADLNGGVHHQTAAKVILEKKFSSKQTVISEAPLGLILELSMKFLYMELSEFEQNSCIKEAIEKSKEKIVWINSGMVEG